MIFRTYRFKLSPTPEQETACQQTAAVCRLVYNLAYEQRRDFFRQYQAITGRGICYFSQSAELKDLRAAFDWIAAVPHDCLAQALRDLDKAYQAFFAGRAKYPSPRKKGVNESFRLRGVDAKTRKLNAKWSAVWLSKIGWVKYRDTRPLAGTVRTVEVVWRAGAWHVSFACEINHETPQNSLPAVGIDRGVANTLALSTGELLSVPDKLLAIDQKYRTAQSIAARRKRGSKRHKAAQRRAAALSAYRARIRRNWHHNASLDIAQRFGVVAIEDLSVARMTAKGRGKRGLNRSILNQGWGTFERLLAYKLEERGGRLVKVPAAYTSQTCPDCGTIDRKSRESQSSFACRHCGFEEHADISAAINIRQSMAGVEAWRRPAVEARTINLAKPGDANIRMLGAF